MKIKYAHSNELDNLCSADVFYRLSLAYIDSAIHLCVAMNNNKFKQTYSRGNVILFLFHHSIELFLKSLIYKNNLLSEMHKLKNKMHNLDSLNNILKSNSIDIELPFQYIHTSEDQSLEDFEEIIPQDQFYRYHIDKKGNHTGVSGAFSSKSLVKELRSFKKVILSYDNNFNMIDEKYNSFEIDYMIKHDI